MAVRIIGHRGIVLQTKDENVTLMVLESFDHSFCYTSFTAWIQATAMWVFIYVYAGSGENAQEMRNIPSLHLSNQQVLEWSIWAETNQFKWGNTEVYAKYLLTIIFLQYDFYSVCHWLYEALCNWEYSMKGTQLYI